MDDYQNLIRDALDRPDSPIGLALQSLVNRQMAPRLHGWNLLVDAIADHTANATVESTAALSSAWSRWEALTGQPLCDQKRAELQDLAQKDIEQRRCAPPPLESVLGDLSGTELFDAQYEFAGLLGGLRGTWHRLWALLSFEHATHQNPNEGQSPAVRQEFEDMLGRGLTESEYATLEAHARHHAETVLGPRLETAKANWIVGPDGSVS